MLLRNEFNIYSKIELLFQRAPRESIEDWEIPANEIQTEHRIGAGSFGTVHKGHWHGMVDIFLITDLTSLLISAGNC